MSEFGAERPLYSGMPLYESPDRQELDKWTDAAYEGWYTSWGIPARIEQANKIANTVPEIDGEPIADIQIVEPGDYGRDYEHRCGHYAFGQVKGEDWATPRAEIPADLFNKSVSFLAEKGYNIVPTGTEGDIVGYTHRGESYLPEEHESILFSHFGVVEPEGDIVSKFNQGPVVRHPIDMVPKSFGTHAYFLRNNNSPEDFSSPEA